MKTLATLLSLFVFLIPFTQEPGGVPSSVDDAALTQDSFFCTISEALVDPLRVKVLDLGCRIDSFSLDGLDQLKECTNLTHLNLSMLKLTELPAEVCQLTTLTDLQANHNYISELPDDLSKLVNLKNLSLLYNSFVAIPEQLCGINQLEEINLNGNRIMEYPECLQQSTKLKVLCIAWENSDSLDVTLVNQLKNVLPKSCRLYIE